MYIKTTYLIIMFLLSNLINAQTKFDVEIATWYKNKPAAVSLSFDDASFTQYEYAYPILEKYKIKATFSLVGDWTHEKPESSAEPGSFEIKKMGWNEIIRLHNSGHEIAAHGYSHVRYNKNLPEEDLILQMQEINNLIKIKIKAPVYTLHYPFSFTTDKIIDASEKAGFLFCRTGRDTINPSSPEDMNLLFSKAILNNNTPDSVEFIQWLKDTEGKWLILMYHHLFTEDSKENKILEFHNVKNTYSLYPATFEQQLRLIINSDYWIAPISSVGKYIVERDNINLKVRKICKTIKIKTESTLDTLVYNQPVSLVVKTKWEKVVVTGSLSDGEYYLSDNTLLIDVLPNKTITIKRLR